MKNLKNMFAWITLALLLTVGTIGANAGIIVGDRTTPAPCTERSSDGGVMISDFVGVMIADFTGIMISDFTGVMIADATCQNGVMIAD